MGSYDPNQEHEALQPDDGAPEEYFKSFGYGDQFGDGSLGDLDEEDSTLLANAETRQNVIEWAVVLMGAVLLALFLRAVLVQAFWIPTSSMESTLLVQDRVLVNKLSYRLGDISRGDIVVFHRTDDEVANNPGLHPDVIKRVIAFEGEVVEIIDNTVFIDGEALSEPYLDEGTINRDFGPVEVPAGQLFVMGDNREGSADSRSELGPVDEDRVVGRAFVRFWPVSRMGGL
jgi:signal peptidase I